VQGALASGREPSRTQWSARAEVRFVRDVRLSRHSCLTAQRADPQIRNGPRPDYVVKKMTKLNLIPALTGLALFAAACGGSAVPLDKLTDAKSTVRAAQEAGATNNPQAALHLKMANDELASAQRALDDKDNDKGRLLLNQAQSDADLSLALARGAEDKQNAQEAQAKIVDLSKQAQ
jgi:Domain of unknown function (DUF4398)